MSRPHHQLRSRTLAFGALVALTALATNASPASGQTPGVTFARHSNIAPELSSVPVSGYTIEAISGQYEQAVADLQASQQLAQSGAARVADLQGQDDQLTGQLSGAIAVRKRTILDLSRAHTTVKALATTAYVEGSGSAQNDDILGTSLPVHGDLSAEDVAVAFTRSQLDRARTTADALTEVDHQIDDTVSQRAAIRVQLDSARTDAQQAAADAQRLSARVAELQTSVLDARSISEVQGTDFQLVALDAYWRAANQMAVDAPSCGIRWWALAGITRVESKHGTFGGSTLTPWGDTTHAIVGIPLDGTNDTAVIGDTDGGALDGDPTMDRAVGPMQFIPSTWRRWARDGNGDGIADPNNIYDAALAAAHYLCASGPMQTDDQMTRGFLSYNQSSAYAAAVLGYAKQYSQLVMPTTSVTSGG